MKYLEGLNSEQYQSVIAEEKPICVIASAGSGKTRCLTSRIQHYLENGANPSTIWACTFTKKAAENMKQRLISNGCDPFMVRRLKVGTLHSLAYWILRQFYKNYAPEKDIDVVSDQSVWMFLTQLAKNGEYKNRDVKAMLAYISINKLNLISPEAVFESIRDLIEAGFTEKTNTRVAFYNAYKEYERYLNSNNYIDFSDMLYKTFKYLKNEKYLAFTNKITSQVSHLLVDEFQDTNRVSYELYKILSQDTNSFFVVGDSRQAIYSFQGSSHTYFDEFIRDYNPKIIQLSTNYRSSKTIVETSNVFMDSLTLDGISKANTPNEVGFPIRTISAIDELSEAQNIRDLILELVDSGNFSYGDIAVLYRVNAQSVPIMDYLLDSNIPHVVFSKGGYFKRREVRQVVTYLKAMIDPHSLTLPDIKLIMNAPIRYISNMSIEQMDNIEAESIFEKMSKVDYLDIKPFQKNAIFNLYLDIKEANNAYNRNQFKNTQEAILYILEKIDLNTYFNSDDSNETAIDADEDKGLNIDVLMSISERYTDIEQFIVYAQSMSIKKNEDENTKDKVKLLTMHSSKGMEFPVVIIAGFCSRFHPLYRANTEEDYQEERRVAYVGITRAEKLMYISTILQNYSKFKVTPSMYISDMGLENSYSIDEGLYK